jgi:superfamily I DNA/RNA helicase
MTADTKYTNAKQERQKYVDAVLASSSKKNIVVAGPGTGKTYLFKQILINKKNSLTLTFVNALVEDLSLELCGLSDVQTLHGYARSALGKATSSTVKIYPKLSKVIKEDAKLLLGQDIDFDHIFHNRDDENEHIEFYKKRKDYYDKYYGYSDIIFAIVKYFEERGEEIPIFEQVVVDEFQDFNTLEVSLIDLLARKSPIVLAGDDDQALYAFKSATTEHIRQRFDPLDTEYSSFTLPYCSRCTSVIIEAINDIIASAVANGNLKGRVTKEYKYFEDLKKDKECELHPKIAYTQCFAKQIPWFIQKSIGEIAEIEKGAFSVLVISPTKLQTRFVATSLKSKGFENVQFTEKNDDKSPLLMEGLKILLGDKESNLGWRILSKLLLNEDDFKTLLSSTSNVSSSKIYDLLEGAFKSEIESVLKTLKAVKIGKIVKDEDVNKLLKLIGVNALEVAQNQLREDLINDGQKNGNPGLRKIPIKATTIQSSKGLSADYVFITHFDDQYFIKHKNKSTISDQDICNFLVALTRAKKKVFLISTNTEEEPTFLKWIEQGRIEKKT